jgi:amidase
VSQTQESAVAAAGIAGMSAVDIAARVRDGRLSAVDVVAAHLERIRAVDPRLNAFQVVLEASGIEEARALSGRPDLAELPLAGVPVAIKDNTDIAGQPTRHGSEATTSLPALTDDEIVRRFRQAGAVIIGKTRLPELAIWPFTESDAYGVTRNPWDPSLTCGGSSGGSAVAVATGMAAIASASDGGGSIRIPSAACGVFGLKPAPDIVPMPGGRDEHWFGLSAFGAIARTTADAGLALDVIAATNRYRDPQLPAASLQIAVSARHPALGARVSADVRSALTATAAALRQAGHDIQHADPPYPSTPQLFLRCWLGGIAEDARGLSEFQLEPRTRGLAATGRQLMLRGLVKPAAELPWASRARAWFAGHDLLLAPVLAGPPPRAGKWKGKGWIETAYGVAQWMGFNPPWNLAGFPACSVPAGLGSDGIPLAVQLVAPPGGESLLLSVAAQLEQLRPWPIWRPA